jgi:hypothetical protein
MSKTGCTLEHSNIVGYICTSKSVCILICQNYREKERSVIARTSDEKEQKFSVGILPFFKKTS